MIRNILIIFLLFISSYLWAQLENVPVSHPVYEYLFRAEAEGLLPNFSTSNLPLQRIEIIAALNQLHKKINELSANEKILLKKYLQEFELFDSEKAVIIYSNLDTNQLISSEFITDKEKFIYHYKDSNNTVNILPLGNLEFLTKSEENVTFGNLGFRIYGSLGSHFGYYLQATNGVILSGKRDLALEEIHKLQQNVKFADLNSDFDFTESHINFNYDWFLISIGRQTRLMGSGLTQRLFLSSNSPAQDFISLSAKFEKFEYHYSHSSLLATDQANIIAGFNSQFPSKYLVMHRAAFKPNWGEVAVWEGLIYSKRGIDFAYLNPLSFFKSLEHALHDRDNSLLGADFTIRPFHRLQLKGSFILDDIKFEEIGKKFWSNKTAWNLSAIYIFPFNLDFGLEYSRVEPYSFSHFDSVNSYTNDGFLLGTSLLPNSDELSILLNYWIGERYPITAKINYQRHGNNIYDKNGNLVKNVGGDPFQTRRPLDSEKVNFLDGDLSETLFLELSAGYEIFRGLNFKILYKFNISGFEQADVFRISLNFEDF